MGQDNQKITIQKIDSPTQVHRTRKIFPNKYKVSAKNQQSSVCDRPNCRCPSTHIVRQNLKLCEACDNPSKPTVRKNNKLSYEESVVLKEHRPTWEYHSVHRQDKIVQIQEPVYYYNGWGLPTQKCYVDAIIRQLPPEVEESGPSPAKPRPKTPQHKIPDPSYPQPQKIVDPPSRPISVNIEQVDVRNRMQNLFLFP